VKESSPVRTMINCGVLYYTPKLSKSEDGSPRGP
jgi:hypothetical protein